MKRLALFILVLSSVSAFGSITTFNRLAAVNSCWHAQPDVNPEQLPALPEMSDHKWIQTHLAFVEATLRHRATTHLSSIQKANRLHCLDILREYGARGQFPINEHYAYRTPIFIDAHNNFCAVGHLVMATGHEDVSRMIATRTNLAYVKDMHYPELDEWAAANGFTTDELAWIQPGYPPSQTCGKVGNGVDGEVLELFTDVATNRLYVGGRFSQADGTIAAANVAWVSGTTGNYVWHAMGAGVNGPVYAIAAFDNKIFVGGSFSMAGGVPADNIAYWDGTAWHAAGCVNGTVYDLAVHKGALFAGGEFENCTALPGRSLAKWDGVAWQTLPGITGRVNTIRPTPTSLAVGGSFDYGSVHTTMAWWNEVSSFALSSNHPANEVMALEIFKDTLYAACRQTDATDTTTLLLKLRIEKWVPAYEHEGQEQNYYPYYGTLALNTLKTEGESLNIGGQFRYSPLIGTTASNCISIGGEWPLVDSAVNKMELYNGSLILGGRFRTGNAAGGGSITLNGITERRSASAAVADVTTAAAAIRIYPQPAHTDMTVTVQTDIDATGYSISDMAGRLLQHGAMKGNTVHTHGLAPGMYLLSLSTTQGSRHTARLVVE